MNTVQVSAAVGAGPDADLLVTFNGIVVTKLAQAGREIMDEIARCLQSHAMDGEKTSVLLARIEQKVDEVTRGQAKLLANGPAPVPAPLSENDAVRLFALLRSLELETNFRKAPVTRVFILYCLDAKSRNAVARECNCSAALITLRLKAIEKKLGCKPRELRHSSSHFERMVDSLSDSRARRIDRGRAIDGDDPGNED